MLLRSSGRTKVRQNKYVVVAAKKSRRRREDNMVEIRKSKREESLLKIVTKAFAINVNPVENSQQIVSTGGDDGSNIISILLFIAFIGLSILTIGVIYIAVTDFLQKREKEKFEKEEAAKKKKSGKKRKVRARAGARGFGQKLEDDDDDYLN
ncbi:hypothetical protein F0562_000983 [Nyssa sinensis]|uniref:IBB domain-containing protein n=1 Tax=Nyssa sinensis TaxID=561372 RepID=A0A5J5C296_9ASTE|nr:hypothetical protein F0562_000983 [Nyssa sinensis]